VGVAVGRRPRLRLACAALALAGAGAHGLAARREAAHWPASAARIEATVEARVVALTRRSDGVSALLDGVRRVDGGREPLPPRARVRSEPARDGLLAAASAGDRVRARVRLAPLRSRANPGGEDPAERARRAGIGADGALSHPALAARAARGPLQALRAAGAARRREAADRLAARGAGLAAALALGERGALDPEAEEALRASGLAHLLSVSGLHLAMAAGLAFAIARRALLLAAPCALPDPRRAALLAAWAAAAAYAAVTGFEVPVRRSLLFLTVVCAGALARRRVRGGALVAAAALAVLAREPEALFDPGARLSFACAAALALARPPAREADAGPAPTTRGARLRRALDASLRASASAIAAGAPLVALHFGRLAPAALAANLAAVPLTGAVLLPASLAAAAAAALAPDATWLAAAPAAVVRLGEKALVALAALATRGPGAERVVAPGPAALAACAACALLALRARATGARIGAAALGHAILLVAPPPALLPAPPRVVALDVGQADATLVQGREAAVLVDAASALAGGADLGRRVVRPALAALGVRRLDVFAVSHADLDHRGGAPAIVESLPIGALWLPAGAAADPAFADLVARARRRGVRVEEKARGDPPVAFGDLRVEVLWPPRVSDHATRRSVGAAGPGGGAAALGAAGGAAGPDAGGAGRVGAVAAGAGAAAGRAPGPGLSDNDRSLVLRVAATGGARVLLPGDVEAVAEAALAAAPEALAAEVVKLPHHGSRTSSSEPFLRATGAALAIASAPCAGRFAMPHPDVVARVARAGATLWWTGRDGAVVVGLAPPLVVHPLGRASLRERARCAGR